MQVLLGDGFLRLVLYVRIVRQVPCHAAIPVGAYITSLFTVRIRKYCAQLEPACTTCFTSVTNQRFEFGLGGAPLHTQDNQLMLFSTDLITSTYINNTRLSHYACTRTEAQYRVERLKLEQKNKSYSIGSIVGEDWV